ncbi:GAF domain-containing protein [Streptomyces longispororuber]|uniref:GAF domain-containing protein n=1 Tax=Streptomyces longispororuber TaxID=68230 RepID=A0A919E1K7_9ACTN|nr:GAF and ANTAR domain-containing protein [Streptomyces longispororuber]GHF01571.1 GAF domain-containing protein [Streptomyces longispororuber]
MPAGDQHGAPDATPSPGETPAPSSARVSPAAHTGPGPRGVPADTVRSLGLDALTMSVTAGDGLPELVWSQPPEGLGPELEELQFALGDGPTFEAAGRGRRVMEPDLAATDPARWPAFLPVAARTPARAVVAVPLRLGVAVIGVLAGYRTSTGPLTDTQRRDLTRLARTLLALLLDTVEVPSADGTGAPPGLALRRAEVHQATGYLSVRLGIPPGQALLRLRSHAAAHDVPLTALARALFAGSVLPEDFDR